ncbi:MAG: hypothetical protein PHR75_00515 [Sulfurovum sp.]|nr:hypothetical protein [Sulfurovum sp.]MDD3602787.1 hypothetical protein [Sulfurovum sp.]
MKQFFILEGGYLILALFAVLITIFVGTRPFVSKNALKKGLMGVIPVLAMLIGGHYSMTTGRMAEVKDAFEKGQPILCESRMVRKAAQSIIVKKSQGWSIEGDNFVSPHYERPFHAARCIVK